MDLQLEGKRALITGGSKGIGKAIARALAAEGCDVALLARTAADLEAAAAEIEDTTGRRALALPADTTSDEQVRDAVAQMVAELGGVDILVNCAADPAGQGQKIPGIEELDAKQHFEPEMNTKVMGYARTARECVPHMKREGWGRIINVAGLQARSSGSIVGTIRNVAVAALTKNLADELGPFGITATVVHPGLTRTEATPGVIARRAEATGQSPEEVERRMSEANAVKQLIDADDIAYVAVMLASPRSIALNGDTIAAGGGSGSRAVYY